MRVDTLFYNANFFISPSFRGDANWLAVNDGCVVAFGRGKPYRHILFKKKIDLQCKRVFPGWIDSHVHLCNLGLRSFEANVSHCRSSNELISSLRGQLLYLKKKNSSMKWLEAYGLDTSNWPQGTEPTAIQLDRISTYIPILVRRVDEHALWANTLLLQMARVTEDATDEKGGKIERDEHGQPTGFLQDRAMGPVFHVRPQPSPQIVEKAFIKAEQSFLSFGITSVHDMSMQRLPLDILISLMRSHSFRLRVYGVLYGEEAYESYPKPHTSMFNYQLGIRAKKIFVDGALGSRGAWLSEAYHDQPDWKGLCLIDADELLKQVRDAIQKRFQLVFHTLGNEASRWVLEILSSTYVPLQLKDKRFRFEHLELVDWNVISMMKRFGMIASVQPWHAISDSAWLERRLGRSRLERILPLKAIVERKVHLCGGSDSPIEPHNPFLGLYASVFREPLESHEAWWLKQNRIRLEEAIHMYTLGGAYAEFNEKIKGSLDVGKLADFSVLSHDIFKLHPREFKNVHTVMTVIGGDIVYER